MEGVSHLKFYDYYAYCNILLKTKNVTSYFFGFAGFKPVLVGHQRG